MRMAFKVARVDVAKAVAKAAIAKKRALVMTTNAARMDTRPYIPRVSGALVGTGETESQPERGLLIYGNNAVPYARAQYYNFPNKTQTKSPQAAMQWFEQSKAANKGKWIHVHKREYDSTFGG